MKILASASGKGGVGKTTVDFNLSKFFSEVKNKRVLVVDGDSSCNLTYSFKVSGTKTIYDLFKTGETEIYNVSKNIDIILGSENLTDDKLDLKSVKQNVCLIFFMWIASNYEFLNENYDYIVIDTRNDSSLVTANFLAVTDVVLGIADPSRNSYRAWLELQEYLSSLKSELVDPISKKSYVSSTAYLIGNKIKNTEISSEFIEILKQEANYLGSIPEREIINDTLLSDTSIWEKYDEMPNWQKKRYKKLMGTLTELFEKIYNIT